MYYLEPLFKTVEAMKTQMFKGKRLNAANVVKNILAVYNRADNSFTNDWYKEANSFAQQLAASYKVHVSVSCGVIAALSPIKTWGENKIIAELFLRIGKAKHTRLFTQKAEDILTAGDNPEQIAAILNGRKITSFFYNILSPDNSTSVTIDRHALSIALGYSVTENEYRGITAKQYAFFERAYIVASQQHQIKPVLMQSITWQQWRKEKGIIEQNTADYVPF